MKKSTKRLALQPQTLRALVQEDLNAVGGGLSWTLDPTAYCPQSGSPMCRLPTGNGK